MSVVIDGTTGISGNDGSAATPSLRGDDANTGVFFPAVDTVAVATGGSERMRVTSAGDVGIGTSSPAFSSGSGLEVQRDSATATIRLQRLNTGASSTELRSADTLTELYALAGGQGIAFGTGTTERLRIASAGQIGIGGANYGTSGQVLTSGGSGAAPSWAAAPAPTSAQVGSATSDLAVGALGTYAMLQQQTLSTSRSPGATLAGSSLRYAAINGGSATAPSGTWMLVGQIGNTSIAANNTSVWLRIS